MKFSSPEIPKRLPAFLVIGWLISVATATAADQPNILWITVEDMSCTLGCYGDPEAQTPHIDQLAKESVRYTRAFATSPVCSPTRSTLITGVYSTTLGTHDLRSAFPISKSIHAWPQQLRKAGYFTTNNVKTDYNTSDEPRLIREAWDENSNTAHWRQKKDGQPFFAIFNDMTTHQSRTGVWPRQRFEEQIQSRLKLDEIHQPADMRVPPWYPDNDVVRRGLARFYDCVSVMDQNVGRLIAQLKEDGLYESTILFFYSDHGSGLPRGKRVLYDSGLRVPLLIRFPKKFQHLAPSEPGTTSDRLVSFVDFPPTVLSLLKLKIPPHMQGKPFLGEATVKPREYVFGARDRVDEAYDKSRSVRDERFLYIRNFRPDRSQNQPSVYSDFSELRQNITSLAASGNLNATQMAYAGSPRPAEELFDTVTDPDNIRNLANDPKFKTVRNKLRARLHTWMIGTNDLGLLHEEYVWQKCQKAMNPYVWSITSSIAWQPQMIEAASLIRADESLLDDQLKLLENRDSAIRLHGVYALRLQDSNDARIQQRLRRALKDPDGAVRIEAAFGLADVKFLAAELSKSDDENLVLRASRALELLGPAARSELDTLQATLQHWRRKPQTPITLFIRFSLEAALARLGHPVKDAFRP